MQQGLIENQHNNRIGSLKRLDNLDSDKNPRNRQQAVHNIVNNGDNDVKNEFDANYNVDQNEDKAKENDDEDFHNDDEKIVLSENVRDGVKGKGNVQNGEDSNQAIETFRESYEQGLGDDDEDGGALNLPPKDGSLKVHGRVC